ncbi:MAG: helix-turn-helix transcriptional regulator [Nitrososphaerota archaeon]|nr:helix-turn-helix transcriptional regulator [Nitrososphaerota archaeon]
MGLDAEDFDTWLPEALTGGSPLSFGEIVARAMKDLGLSRATVARRLSRMVEAGSVARTIDGRYSLPGHHIGDAEATATVVEVINSDGIVIVDAFGGIRVEFSSTLRVVSGVLSRYWLAVSSMSPPPGEHFQYAFSNYPARLCQGEIKYAPPGVLAHYLEFAEPIPAKDTRPVHCVFGQSLPPAMRMYRGAPLPASLVGQQGNEEEELVAAGVVSRPFPSLVKQVGPRSSLGCRVHFPARFPKGPARLNVSDVQSGLENRAEEGRIERLSKEKDSLAGLKEFGDTVSLGVPSIKLDTNYMIQWSLPSEKMYRSWLADFSRWRKGRSTSPSR